MSDDQSLFNELQSAIQAGGAAALLERLTARLKSEKRYHELFDARLMAARLDLGLPIIMTGPLDDLDEPLRTRMEEAYLAACREVGGLLISDDRVRDAWMYLRPVGERAAVAEALSRIPLDSENYDQVIEVALYEGVCPRLGFQHVLEHYGTCNAITIYDGQLHSFQQSDRQEVVALLVRHLHNELIRNVKSDITEREGKEAQGNSLAELVANRPLLFEKDNYHVDTTHLSSVVRFALVCDDPETLRLALDLTEYGRRLGETYQVAGQDPFTHFYAAHRLFFRALLGEDPDATVKYFRERTVDAADSGPAEVLVALLARLGRDREAFEATVELLPMQVRTSGFAPSMLELARRAGCYDRLVEACRKRNDALGFAAGLLERARAK